MKIIKKITSVLVVLGVFYGGYFWMQGADLTENVLPSEVEQAGVFEPAYQVQFLETYALCDEYNLGCKAQEIAGGEELNGLSLEAIKAKYPADTWRVTLKGSALTICKLKAGLCADHKKIYHLGLNSSGEYLTICYGPAKVGSNGGVCLSTDIPLLNLDITQREKVLKGYYEANDLEQLQGILDSFSENF